MALLHFLFFLVLLVASSVALPVQPPYSSNISTDDSVFSPAAGQEWGPDVSHYQGDINWADVKKVCSSRLSRVISLFIHSFV